MTRCASVLSCGYTGDGQRAWKQNSSGARTYFLYDGSEPVCEMNSSGNLTAVNDFGADGVWARHTQTTDWFYTFDPQGCLSQKISRSGSVMCSSVFNAQGHEATTDTHPDPFSGYGGQWGYYADWETSGDNGGSCLYLLGHRFYDPNAGRFINRDPIGYRGGVNVYAYTGNDPVNRADPSGLAQLINIGDGPFPDHTYLIVNCGGGPRDSYGFYPSGTGPVGGALGGTGDIEHPDHHGPPDPSSSTSIGTGYPAITNTNPSFNSRLCHCIFNSIAEPPEYNATPGNKFYVCYSWADDKWDCAYKHPGVTYLGPGY